MFAFRFPHALRSPSAVIALAAGVLTLGSACSKEQKVEQLWEGPAKLNYVGVLPKATPASKTSFDKVVLPGAPAKLVAPVDWKQRGAGTEAWRNALHRWDWIWPLLVSYQEKQDAESLKQATLIALDWIKADLSQQGATPGMWSSGNAAWRAPALGYLIHAGSDAKLITGEQQQQLITSARKHAAYLANDDNYKSGKYASLYLDYGLAAMCANLNKLKDCQVWKDIAKQRVIETAGKMFDADSGVQTGQSPLTHARSVGVLAKMAELIDAPALKKVIEQAKDATGWLVPPDGRHSLVGTNTFLPAPAWATERAKKAQGVQLLGKSGYAAVRDGESYLFATASYYDKKTKHSDDLSFVWSEKGQRILEDSGNSKKPEFSKYARSAVAHNVLTIDGKDFPPSRPYKSGMRAVGKADGWYALSGRNPVLIRTAEHERTWLYQPGKLLLVIDNVDVPKETQFDRYFHFWYTLKVKLDAAGQATTTVKGTPLRVFDASGDAEVERKLVRDQKDPVQGMMFLNARQSKPDDVLQLTSKGAKSVLVTAFVLGDSKLASKDIEVQFEHDVYYVRVGDEKLALSRSKEVLNFELGVGKGQSKVAKENEANEKVRAAEALAASKLAGAAEAGTTGAVDKTDKAEKGDKAPAPKAPAAAPKPGAPKPPAVPKAPAPKAPTAP